MFGIFNIRSHTWTHAAAGLAIIAGLLFSMALLVHLSSQRKGMTSGAKLVAVQYAKAFVLISDPRLPWRYYIKKGLKVLLRPTIAGVSPFYYLGLIHYFLIYLTSPPIALVSVERMVRQNHLVTTSALGSAGQVIAMFTGITSVFPAVWELVSKWWKLRQKDGDDTQAGANVQSENSQGEQKLLEQGSGSQAVPTGSESVKDVGAMKNKTGDQNAVDEDRIEEVNHS